MLGKYVIIQNALQMFIYIFIGSVRTMSDWEEDEETVNPLPLSAYFPGTFGCKLQYLSCTYGTSYTSTWIRVGTDKSYVT